MYEEYTIFVQKNDVQGMLWNESVAVMLKPDPRFLLYVFSTKTFSRLPDKKSDKLSDAVE